MPAIGGGPRPFLPIGGSPRIFPARPLPLMMGDGVEDQCPPRGHLAGGSGEEAAVEETWEPGPPSATYAS